MNLDPLSLLRAEMLRTLRSCAPRSAVVLAERAAVGDRDAWRAVRDDACWAYLNSSRALTPLAGVMAAAAELGNGNVYTAVIEIADAQGLTSEAWIAAAVARSWDVERVDLALPASEAVR